MQRAAEYDKHNRDAFRKDMQFFLGEEQWDSTIKAERDTDGRPSLTINQLPRFVDQVIGDIRLNCPRIKTRPESSDASVEQAAIRDGIIKNIEYQSSAQEIYINAMESMVSGGMGAWRVTTKYSSDDTFEQDIRIEWIPNPLSVYFDPRPFDLDKTHADWCFVTEWLTREDFQSRYPGVDPKSLPDVGAGDTAGWFEKDKVKIAEYWLREPIQKTIVQFSDGVVMDEDKARDRLEKDKAERLMLELTTPGASVPPAIAVVADRVVTTYRVRRYIICGAGTLEGPEEFPGSIIPVVQIYGKMTIVDGKRFIRGMVRNAADSQRMYNFWRSAEVEFVALQPKSPWVGTAKEIEGFEKDYKDANRRNIAFLKFNSDPTHPQGPTRQPPPQASPGMFQGSQQALEDMKSTMEMVDASLGLSGNERTGKAITARRVEGDISNFSYVDNLCRGLRLTGRIILGMIPKVIDTSRMLQIRTSEDEEQLTPVNMPTRTEDGQAIILNDLTVGRYGIIVDTGPSFTTMRQEAAEGMMEFGQMYPEARQFISDLVAKAQDWEFSQEISKRLKRTIDPRVLTDNPPQAPPSSQEIVAQSKAQIATLKVDREKIKVMQDTLKLRKEGSDVRKEILNVLEELFS
jgi:polyhydroxyalkanoate synthesis regulator phasin